VLIHEAVTAKRVTGSLHTRLWSRVRRGEDHECWEWGGPKTSKGYGQIGVKRGEWGTAYTHRVSWELSFGPIPDGLCVLHRCDNPSCVNPAHLFLGTRTENNQDMVEKGRYRPYTGWNDGEGNHTAKLNCDLVCLIRHRWLFAGDSLPLMAREFGVSRFTVWKAASGRTWGSCRCLP
jgi:hypothetical protein